MEAGEPEERAAEEKEVEEKDGERKGDRIGSLAKESKWEEVIVGCIEEEEGVLKVESLWRGDAEEEEGTDDLCNAAGEAISLFL